MSDIIEKFQGSVIQHGKDNNRVYLMKLNDSKIIETINFIDKLANKNQYTKIIVKIPFNFENILKKNGFLKEASIPKFYKGKSECLFMSKYFCNNRKKIKNLDEIHKIINLCKQKNYVTNANLLDNFEFKILTTQDIPKITKLYKNVFNTYPFPIFEEDYILETMNDNVCYFGIKDSQGNLVSISSAEIDKENLNAEMTDFATLPNYRGKSLSIYLLQQMEIYLRQNNFKTAYTIARSISAGMNITFAKNDYTFSGTLINNTNISTGIESMNIWYKALS